MMNLNRDFKFGYFFQDKALLEIGKIDFQDPIVAIPEVQVAILALWVLKVLAARPEHQDQEVPVVPECHQGHQVVLHHNGAAAALVIVVLILADLMVNLHG